MSLTDEQRSRFEELSAARKRQRKELAVERVKAEMREEIRDFEKRYEFADEAVANRLRETLDRLPFRQPGAIDHEKLRECRDFLPEYAGDRQAWFCSLCGSEEIFDIFVKGRLSDFLADYDDWYFYGAYMLLMYDDFSGFVYIDDNGNMTEAII